jgi:hypothetical protein
MRMSELFYRCVHIAYTHVENGGDFAIERYGNTLYVYLQCSDGSEDWKNNLDFPAVPYRHMGRTVWFAHRGFLRVWKSIEPYLARLILDSAVKKIVTVGYSHGAALAVLCHEYVYFHRPDLHENIFGYGFGCPRVIWGVRTQGVCERWKYFTTVRNLNDLVTHLPPALFGFFHVGKMLEIGARGRYSPIDAHRPEHILTELQLAERLFCISNQKAAPM